jgi:hypothetical protein
MDTSKLAKRYKALMRGAYNRDSHRLAKKCGQTKAYTYKSTESYEKVRNQKRENETKHRANGFKNRSPRDPEKVKEQCRKYYAKNKEKFKKYAEENRERIAKKAKERYAKNKDHNNQVSKDYYNKHKERLLVKSRARMKKYRLDNPEKVRANQKRCYLRNKIENKKIP